MRPFLLAVTAVAVGLSALGCGGSSDDKSTAATPAATTGTPEPTPTPAEPPAYVVPPTVNPMNVSPIDTAPPPIIPVSLDTPAGPMIPQLEPPTIQLPPLPPMMK